MHRRTGEKAVLPRIHRQPAVRLHQGIQRRVQEHRQRAEHHHRRHGHRDLCRAATHHGFGGHHRCRAADRAASTDQHRCLALHLEHAHTQPAGQAEGAGDHQHVHQHAADADVADVLEGQAQAVQHDAGAQQPVLGKADTGRAARRQPRVEGVADHDAGDDGHGQRTQAVCLQPRQLGQVQRRRCDQADQQQAGQAWLPALAQGGQGPGGEGGGVHGTGSAGEMGQACA